MSIGQLPLWALMNFLLMENKCFSCGPVVGKSHVWSCRKNLVVAINIWQMKETRIQKELMIIYQQDGEHTRNVCLSHSLGNFSSYLLLDMDYSGTMHVCVFECVCIFYLYVAAWISNANFKRNRQTRSISRIYVTLWLIRFSQN